MRALVTGGCGLVGSHIADLLLSKGYAVTILDNLDSQVHPEGRPPWISSRFTFIKGDIRVRSDVKFAVKDADVVFHEAAFGGFTEHYAKYLDVNATGTALLYEEMAKTNVKKCVVASSQAVYGRGGLLRETDECHPNTPYGISKYAEERIAQCLGELYGIPTVCLRYGVTYGPRQSLHNPYTGIISIFAAQYLNGNSPVIFEDGHQTRDMIYVGDVAAANLFCAENVSTGVFNVATGEGYSVLYLAETLGKLLGKDILPMIPGLYRPQDVRDVLHETRALATLGWRAKWKLDDGLKEFVDWVKGLDKIPDNFTLAFEQLKEKGIIRRMSTDEGG